MKKMKFWKAQTTGLLFAATTMAATGCSAPGAAPTTHIVPERAALATDVGAMAATQSLTLVLGVKIHDESLIPQTIEQIRADRSRALTPADFADRFSVTTDTYAQLIAWAQASRLHVTRATEGRTALTVEGAVADIEQAFNIHLRLFQDAQGEFYAPDHEPELSGVLGNVSSIIGLSNSNKWFSHLHAPGAPLGAPVPEAAPPAAAPTPESGAALHTLYNLPTVTPPPGTNAHIAILGVGIPNAVKDGLPADPNQVNYNVPLVSDITGYLGGATPTAYNQIQVGPSSAGDSSDPSGGTWLENTLDAEMVLNFAPAATVNHVFAVSNAEGLFADGIEFIVDDPSQAATHTVTVSYGSCERGSEPEMPVLNALFAQALSQGQQWFFAAGDDGPDACQDGANNAVSGADWPASSPYVIAVGGTQITGGKQVAWGNGGQGAAGGGPSAEFPKPSWQVGTTTTDTARDLPDVSALAGTPGVYITIANQQIPTAMQLMQGIGGITGTSAATPMWAGIWGLLDSVNIAKGSTQGFSQAGPDLYSKKPTGGLTDITGGSNSDSDQFGGYTAKRGYDLATGLGVPNITNLLTQTTWK